MENEAFVDKEMDQNGVECDVKPKKSKKQRSKKTYSVKLEQNDVELNALSKALPNLNSSNDDAESSIGAAVRQGRRSVISREIEKAKRNNSLDSLDDVGFAALHHTTRYCRIDAIEDLLKNGANINVQSRDDHFTALHIATRFGWYDAVEILLKHGADVSLRSKTGATALHLACRRGCPKTTMLLLKQKGVDVDARDSQLKTPLHIASSHGHYHLIIALLDNGADVFALAADKMSCFYMLMMNKNSSSYTKNATGIIMEKVFQRATENCFKSSGFDMKGFTLTHVIAGTNVIEVMKKAIDRGVDVNEANVLNGMTPIHVACRKGFLEMAELLVQSGADIHVQSLHGQTPLHFAAVGGHDHIVRFLIDKGAQLDARDAKNMTPFLLASSMPKAKPSTVQLFIEAGTDINASEAFMKNCFHLAVESENYDLIQFFLGNDDTVNNLYSPDVCERVALHYAAKSGSLKVLKLVLTKQQFLNLQDEDQKTAIYLAAKANRLEHVTALCQAGASLNDRDDEGRTALHAAASRHENRKVCKALVSFGADVNCKDGREKTPLMLAAESGCAKTVKTMLNLNANIDDTSVDGDSALLSAVRTNSSEVVQLLMDRNVKVTHRDFTGAGVFETAVKFDAKDAVNVICRHERYKEVVNNTCSAQGQRPMQILIQHFPEAASIIMSKCICRSANILPTHEDYKVSYDFELLDPGPDDGDCLAGHRYFGPATMVKHKRQDLLLHPLTEKILEIKWQSFGSKVYYLSLFLYFWYMIGYSYFVVVERGREFPRNFTTVKLSEIYTLSESNHRIAVMIIAFAAFQLFREVIQIFGQRLRYFKQPENYMEWVLYSASIFFVLPYVGPSIIYKSIYSHVTDVYYMWLLAIVSIFLSYANFVLFLRRFTLFGIYITMFMVVFRSLLRVMVVFLEFMVAFAVVFYILFKEQPSFNTFGYATAKTIAMSIGEMDFTSIFIDSIGENNKMTGHPLNPFPQTAFVFAAIFMSVMCVTLMNLLIGLAIGDIDNVQRSAELQRLSMQVEFVAEIEEKYPRFITRRLYKPIIDVMPNKKTISWRLKKIQTSFQGALKDLTSTTGEAASEREENNTNIMAETLEKNRRQIKALVSAMDVQASLIKSIAEKVDSHFKAVSAESLKFEEPLREKNIDEEED